MDDELIDAFQRHWNRRGLRSGKHYGFAVQRFLRWIRARQKTLSEVKPALVHEYLLQRRTPEHRLTTIKAEVDRLRTFFHFAVSCGKMRENPALGVSHRWLDEPGGLPAYQGVLRRIFRIPRDILRFRLPLFAPYWENYLQHLLDHGYSRGSLRGVMEHNAHFHGFLTKQGVYRLSVRAFHLLDAYLNRFDHDFQKVHRRPLTNLYRTHIRRQITGFLAFAKQVPAVNAAPRKGKGRSLIPDTLLEKYKTYCRVHRGLSLTTAQRYLHELTRLRSYLTRRGVGSLRMLSINDIDAFFLRRAQTLSPRGLESIGSAVRSFFRYLYLEECIPHDLAAAVASPSRFHADLRPKYLPWKRVEELLESVECLGAAGKRDYAVLTLLADHGLRAREVAALRTEDIDFDRRCLLLRHRKNGATVDLPISKRAIQALRDYLAIRREHSEERLFLSACAPVRSLSAVAISNIVQRRLKAVLGSRGGAYALRHSFAKALLDRGARLTEIGALLGHKSLRSTLIYTRVAVEDMREVADNYAGFL